jgi:hypothetical protein
MLRKVKGKKRNITKMKGNKLIATFLPYPLQHDQHYDDIMFIFSTA